VAEWRGPSPLLHALPIRRGLVSIVGPEVPQLTGLVERQLGSNRVARVRETRPDGATRTRARATSRSYARKLTGPCARKPKTTPINATRFASAPNFASAQEGTLTNIETTIAHAPIAHQPRGHTNSAAAVVRKRRAASSHTAPSLGEIACVNSGRSANPNVARRQPSRA
jgi:hypothetical protein